MKRQDSQKKRTRTSRSKAKGSSSAGNAQVLQERIAARAYELYRERGVRQGDALSDWLEAERQILGQDDPRGGASWMPFHTKETHHGTR